MFHDIHSLEFNIQIFTQKDLCPVKKEIRKILPSIRFTQNLLDA